MKKIMTLMKKLSKIWTLRLSASSQPLISNCIRFLIRCKVNYLWHKRKAPNKFQIIFQIDKISLLDSWQVLKQIIDKISNWIPDKMQSRLLSAQKEDPDKFQNFKFYFSKIPSYCSSYQDYCSNYCSSYCSTDIRHFSSASSHFYCLFFVIYFTVSSSI